jgi:hypothetical protein
MPLTGKEMKAVLIEHIDALLRLGDSRHDNLEGALDAQTVEVQVISYNTLQIRVLPCGSGACRYLTLKISEQQ